MDFSRKEPGLLGDMMGSRKGTEKQKVNLEYLSVPENKQVLEQMMGKGTPLVVLWLRICLPMEGIQV